MHRSNPHDQLAAFAQPFNLAPNKSGTDKPGTHGPTALAFMTCIAALLLSACTVGSGPSATVSSTAEPTANAQIDCSSAAGIKPACGFRNPEDLVVLPGGDWLLVSEMGPFLQNSPNTLSLFDIAANQRRALELRWLSEQPRWGDANCPAPDPASFSPHGIDFLTLPDGTQQLLVVNHGQEAVEFFEVTQSANPGAPWVAQWRGCAQPGNDLFMNDVAALNDGGFFVTHMWNRSTPFEEVAAKLLAGQDTGWVMEWQPTSGFRKVKNTDALMPNGIAVSADNRHVFINVYMANETLKLDRTSEQITARLSVQQPDNVTVDAETGELWIASHRHDPIAERCEDDHAGPCLLPFQVIKANPATMTGEVAFSHTGAPMGYATVALSHQGEVFLGSASGDRIARVPLAR